MEKTEPGRLSPSAEILVAKVKAILTRVGETKTFVDPALQSVLERMRPSDFDSLCPPGPGKVYWTDDNAFCRRLSAYLFGVSQETIDELPGKYYPYLLKITAANFMRFADMAIPV